MESKEMYVYLDLNGKLDHNFFQKENIYFKMVNIDTDSPLVQVGNFVFQGNYEDFLGTKVFFVEDKNHDQNNVNVFLRDGPFHLKYLTKTAKIMQLKWRKLPSNVVRVNNDNEGYADLSFTENYNTVLEKLDKGALNMQDIFYDPNKKDVSREINVPLDKSDATQMEIDEASNDRELTEQTQTLESGNVINRANYKLLKDVVATPLKQKETQKLYEVKKEHLAKVENPENFPVLSQLFLQNVIAKSHVIKSDNFNEFNKYVDVQMSIEDGVINDIGENGLTDEEKCKLLSGENFDNFRLPMKLAYLTEQLAEYKRVLAANKNSLQETDNYGRTLNDKYKLLKDITKQVWYYVYSNADCDNM